MAVIRSKGTAGFVTGFGPSAFKNECDWVRSLQRPTGASYRPRNAITWRNRQPTDFEKPEINASRASVLFGALKPWYSSRMPTC